MAKRRKPRGIETHSWTIEASRPLIPRTDGRKGFLDSLDVQISVRAKVPKGTVFSRRVIEEAIKYRCAHGRNPRGFTITIQRWRNPDRTEGDPDEVYTHPDDAEGQAGWRKYGKQQERFDTLGRALRGSKMVYRITRHRIVRGKVEIRITVSRLRPRKSGKASANPRGAKNRRLKAKMAKVRPNKKGISRRRRRGRKVKSR